LDDNLLHTLTDDSRVWELEIGTANSALSRSFRSPYNGRRTRERARSRGSAA
jgi:hypothetical protein